MFCSKHSNYFWHVPWFHSVFYIEFRFCETLTVINSVTRILLIETLSVDLSVDLPHTYIYMF